MFMDVSRKLTTAFDVCVELKVFSGVNLTTVQSLWVPHVGKKKTKQTYDDMKSNIT